VQYFYDRRPRTNLYSDDATGKEPILIKKHPRDQKFTKKKRTQRQKYVMGVSDNYKIFVKKLFF